MVGQKLEDFKLEDEVLYAVRETVEGAFDDIDVMVVIPELYITKDKHQKLIVVTDADYKIKNIVHVSYKGFIYELLFKTMDDLIDNPDFIFNLPDALVNLDTFSEGEIDLYFDNFSIGFSSMSVDTQLNRLQNYIIDVYANNPEDDDQMTLFADIYNHILASNLFVKSYDLETQKNIWNHNHYDLDKFNKIAKNDIEKAYLMLSNSILQSKLEIMEHIKFMKAELPEREYALAFWEAYRISDNYINEHLA